MYRGFLCIIIIVSSYLPQAQAQTGTGKKVKTWREQVVGPWRVDSVVIVKKNSRRSDKADPSDTLASHYFLPNNKVIILEKISFSVSDYDLLEGSNERYLKMENQMGLSAYVEKISGTDLVLKYTLGKVEKNPAKQGGEIWMYFSHGTFPSDTLKARIAGSYKIIATKGSLEERRQSDEKHPYSLRLGRNGEMDSYLGNAKDTGTWMLEKDNFNIRLKGKQSTQVFELISRNRANNMVIHPVGTIRDSLIRLESVPEIAPANGREKTNEFLIRKMPEISSADWSRDQKNLCHVWKAIRVFRRTDQGIMADRQIRTIRLNLQNDGNLSFFEGENTYVGEWRQVPGKAGLILNIMGEEIVADYRITKVANKGSDGLQVTISFTPPSSEELHMYFFEAEN